MGKDKKRKICSTDSKSIFLLKFFYRLKLSIFNSTCFILIKSFSDLFLTSIFYQYIHLLLFEATLFFLVKNFTSIKKHFLISLIHSFTNLNLIIFLTIFIVIYFLILMKDNSVTFLFKTTNFIIFLILINFFFIAFHTKAQEGKALFATCSACHTIGGGRLIGPDLIDINKKHNEEWLIRFIRNSQAVIASGDEYAKNLFNEYNKIPMPSINLTDDQIKALLEYIKNYKFTTEETKTIETKTDQHTIPVYENIPSYLKETESRNYFIYFIICLILMLLAIGDILFFKIIKTKALHFILIATVIYVMGEIIVIEAQALGRQQYYSPEQPIVFSHKIHTGQNRIDCQYCHYTAEKSKFAGIPPTVLCMNCHQVVKNGTQTGTFEIGKIYKALEKRKSIAWIKVHNLPDHVFFNHAQHVNIAQINCRQCHGPVEKMDRIIQVEDLSMGWCINCHRKTQVQFSSNKFYEHYTKLQEKFKSNLHSKITVDNTGGNDCQKCHY